MRRSRFVGAGAALPSRVVPNAEIEDRLGLEHGWIERTGIRERRMLGDDATVVDPADRGTATLFGDGAGAVVLRAEDGERGVLACRLRALGSRWESLYVPAGARRLEELAADRPDRWMHMDGQEVFRTAVEQLVDLTREALAAVGLATADVALFVPHQANVRIIRMMLQLLRIDETRAAI